MGWPIFNICLHRIILILLVNSYIAYLVKISLLCTFGLIVHVKHIERKLISYEKNEFIKLCKLYFLNIQHLNRFFIVNEITLVVDASIMDIDFGILHIFVL